MKRYFFDVNYVRKGMMGGEVELQYDYQAVDYSDAKRLLENEMEMIAKKGSVRYRLTLIEYLDRN